MTDDAELLSQYAQKGSDTAFAALVDRYLPLVYAAALRLVRGDEALAKDVAQTVFIDLARKARSLLGRELLAGWLYTSTRLAASKAVRGARRRQLREQIAVSMQERTTQPESPQDEGELKLVLDEAMSELGSDERNAVLIRFFQGKDLKDVGVALGISEDAARMRVTRALGKLQVLLKARGVTIPTVALGTALATEAVAAVPAGLAATISAAAVASAAAGGGITATLLEFMTKTKIQLGIISVIAVAVVAIPLAIQPQSRAKLREENQVLRQQVSQLAQAAAENERLSNLLAQAKSPASLSREQASVLLKLRGEVGVLRRQNAELHAAQHVGKLEDQTAGADSPGSARFSLHLLADGPAEDAQQMTLSHTTRQGSTLEEVLYMQKTPLLDQTAIASACLVTNWQTGGPQIDITLAPQGASQLAKLTRENIDKRIAFFLNGQLCSSPVIRAEIASGKLQVIVPFPEEQAKQLVQRINEALIQ